MKQRCYYEKSLHFHNYGGRGISVCESWRDSFLSFRDWARANGYEEGLTLDRIDVNGNYEPTNCRWMSKAEQTKNTRRNIRVQEDGECMVLKDWCRKKGLSYASARRVIRLSSKTNPIVGGQMNQELKSIVEAKVRKAVKES